MIYRTELPPTPCHLHPSHHIIKFVYSQTNATRFSLLLHLSALPPPPQHTHTRLSVWLANLRKAWNLRYVLLHHTTMTCLNNFPQTNARWLCYYPIKKNYGLLWWGYDCAGELEATLNGVFIGAFQRGHDLPYCRHTPKPFTKFTNESVVQQTER